MHPSLIFLTSVGYACPLILVAVGRYMLKRSEVTIMVTDVRGVQSPKKYQIRGKGLKLMAAVFHVPFVLLLAALFFHLLLPAVNGYGLVRAGNGFVVLGCLSGFCSLAACLLNRLLQWVFQKYAGPA